MTIDVQPKDVWMNRAFVAMEGNRIVAPPPIKQAIKQTS
jgi:hypothetical protein